MCYPYGNYNSDTIGILQDTNCKLALTTKGGVGNLNKHKKFELPRIDTNELLPHIADYLNFNIPKQTGNYA